MQRFIKPSILTFSALLFALLGTFVLQAKESGNTTTQAPPVVSEFIDSISSIPFSPPAKTIYDNKSICQVVEDTILPPCDVIFYKSGKLEYCKILETSPTTISYKMCDYLDGPTVIANKSTVQKIRYANGREELVTAEQITEKAPKNAYVKARKDPLARLSFIFGLCSVIMVIILHSVIIALPLAGIVLGIISLAKMGRRRGEFRGKGSAIIGIILSALVLLLLI